MNRLHNPNPDKPEKCLKCLKFEVPKVVVRLRRYIKERALAGAKLGKKNGEPNKDFTTKHTKGTKNEFLIIL